MDFAKEKEGQTLTSVHLRIPKYIRELAQEEAARNSNDDVKVNESDVYRIILINFFAAMTTKCSRNGLDSVSDGVQLDATG